MNKALTQNRRHLNPLRTDIVFAFLCCLTIQAVSLGWQVGFVGPLVLLFCAGVAGWSFRQLGVWYSMMVSVAASCLIFPALHSVLGDSVILSTFKTTVSVGAMAQAAACMRRVIDTLESCSSLDSLTGLLNHQRFMDFLDSPANRQTPLAIVFLDCDDFKSLNDRLGHIAGNRYLHETAHRLNESLQPDEFAARWGGDEFVLSLIGDDPTLILGRVETIRVELARPITAEYGQLTWSIGVALFKQTEDASAMIHAADQAMYLAKKNGPGRTHVMVEAESTPAYS